MKNLQRSGSDIRCHNNTNNTKFLSTLINIYLFYAVAQSCIASQHTVDRASTQCLIVSRHDLTAEFVLNAQTLNATIPSIGTTSRLHQPHHIASSRHRPSHGNIQQQVRASEQVNKPTDRLGVVSCWLCRY